MNHQLSENKLRKLRILIAPLDWGLGHATRCTPIIKEFLKRDCEVFLAGEGSQKSLLQKEFPQLPFLELPGYRISYSHRRWLMPWYILFQIPQILKAIKQEKRWLRSAVGQYEFDMVISDNRYGMHHPKIFSVFITHQLLIKNYSGKWIEKILQKRNYRYINKFNECWIPDNENENNLAGELSHPGKKPTVPVKYIGWLSRMEKKDLEIIKDYLLIMLSGPEPQRSIFENLIIEEISRLDVNATIVRGIPASQSMIPSTNTIKFYNHLPADELNTEMAKADIVIARSGYSTIMEIVSMKKKSILVPTPGQTEQEYLSKYLFEKKVAYYCEQESFSIKDVLKNAADFPYQFPDEGCNKLTPVIETLIGSVSKKEKLPIR